MKALETIMRQELLLGFFRNPGKELLFRVVSEELLFRVLHK